MHYLTLFLMDKKEELFVYQKLKGNVTADIPVICFGYFQTHGPLQITAAMNTVILDRDSSGNPKTAIVFVPNDQETTSGWDVGMIDPTRNRTAFYQQLLAHEIGHALGLSTRTDPKNGNQARYHDGGPFPDQTWGLMWGEPGGVGKWLRHEDWEQANSVALGRFAK